MASTTSLSQKSAMLNWNLFASNLARSKMSSTSQLNCIDDTSAILSILSITACVLVSLLLTCG